MFNSLRKSFYLPLKYLFISNEWAAECKNNHKKSTNFSYRMSVKLNFFGDLADDYNRKICSTHWTDK